MLPLVIISALVDSINPCAFSILLLTIAFLFSMGKLRSNILKVGGIYILGIFIVYILIGLGVLKTLQFFNIPHFMARVGATILILAGLIEIIGHYYPSFPIKLKIPDSGHNKIAILMQKATMPTAFALGVLVGMFEFPCTGGPYLMVLGLLHDNNTRFNGLFYLIIYNLVFVLPLVVILLIASSAPLLEKVRKWRGNNVGNMRVYGGIAMIILGLVIFAL